MPTRGYGSFFRCQVALTPPSTSDGGSAQCSGQCAIWPDGPGVSLGYSGANPRRLYLWPRGSETRVYSKSMDSNRQLHETLGVTVFVLVSLRVIWRLLDEQPDPPEIPRWMDLASKIVQGVLYVLLFLLRITAVSGAWLEGHSLTLLGGLKISPPLASFNDIGGRIAALHTWLGDAIMWIAGAHAAAAIFHHGRAA